MRFARALLAVALAAASSRAEDSSTLPEGAIRRFGSPDGAHSTEILDAVFTPDGKTVVSVDGYTVYAWETPSLHPLFRIEFDEEASFLSISPDGLLLAVNQLNGVFLFSLPGGKPAGRLYGPPPEIDCGTFSADGKRFAAMDEEGGLHVWDVASRAYTVGSVVNRAGSPAGLAWSGDRVVSWDDEGNVLIASGSDLSEVRKMETGADDSDGGAVSPDGKRLAFAIDDGGVRLWDLESGEEVDALVPVEAELASGIAWSRDGGKLAWTNYQDEMCVWSIAEQKVVARSPVRSEGRPVFSPDGAWLLSGIGGCRLLVLRADGAARATRAEGHDGAVRSLEFDAAGRTLWSAGADGNVWVWDLATGASRRILENGAPLCRLGVIEGGARFMVCTPQGGFGVWDGATGKRLRDSGDRMGFLMDAAWAPGAGTMFAIGQNGHGELWDEELSAPLLSIDVAVDSDTRIALSPNGRLLALACGTTVTLFDARSGTRQEALSITASDQVAVAFSPDSAWLASSDKGASVFLTEIASGHVCPVAAASRASLLAFAGATRLVAASDSLVWIDIATIAEAAPASPLPSEPSALAVSRDGRLAATGFHDGTILVWEAPPAVAPKGEAPATARLWEALGGDADEARTAVASCAEAGPDAIRALAEGLAAVPPVPEGVRDLLPGLGSERAEERDSTEEALRQAGPEAEPALRDALRDATAETRGRIEAILASWELPPLKSPALVRRTRALRALERRGSAEAKSVLRKVAQSSPYAWERREAEEALKRLEAR
jgi:WD40 repeat protein